MYSELNVSKLAIHRSMGWLSPRRRQRSSCMSFDLIVSKLAMYRSMGLLSPRRR
jgi:hypothetical protein